MARCPGGEGGRRSGARELPGERPIEILATRTRASGELWVGVGGGGEAELEAAVEAQDRRVGELGGS